MKKILVLMLVLGLATVANATMNLSITTSATTIGSAGTATLGISDSVGYTIGEDAFVVIVVDTSKATITGGSVNGTTWQDTVLFDGTATDNGYPGDLGDGKMASITSIGGTSFGPGQYIIGMTFAPTVTGDITVRLLNGGADMGTWTQVDSKVITVTPEPMTLALLGLGGLFIRRK